MRERPDEDATTSGSVHARLSPPAAAVRPPGQKRREDDRDDPILQLLKPDAVRRVELLGRIARELNAPIEAARSELARARSLDLTGAAPELPATLDEAGASLDYLASVLADMLDLVRIDAGEGIHIDFQAGRLRPIVDEVLTLGARRFESAGLSATTNIPDDLPILLIEPRRLRQVFVNLVGNAIKFTPPDGTIHIGARVDSDSGRLRVEVSDSGVGISAEEQAWIFRPFWQGRAGEASEARGSGLGLTLVREIVERHRGEVGVDSEPDQGSTFWFTLPIMSARAIEEIVVIPTLDSLPRRRGSLSVISVQVTQDALSKSGPGWIDSVRDQLRDSDRVLRLDEDVAIIVAPSCLRAARAITRRVELAFDAVGVDESSYWTGSVTYPSPGVSRAQFIGRTRRLLERSSSGGSVPPGSPSAAQEAGSGR